MAIDRGPWNALVDDDGSNLTGSIWNKAAIKTVILDPVDAALPAPIYGTFTPIDTSGAGLTFAYREGVFSKQGRVVCVWIQVVYPATSNGLEAEIGGLPYPVGTPGAGGLHAYGLAQIWYFPKDLTVVQPRDMVNALRRTNAQMSGVNAIVSGTYLTA